MQGASGEVTVTGGTPLINSTQNQFSTSYSPRQLTQLPYNGGSIDNLALLTPGVLPPGDTDFSNSVGISSNGNRGRSNNFQIDGQDNNDNSVAGPTLSITNSEAIGDYQITTNNPSAEFGRNAGAQINVITKSGTNEFRGSLFEFFQNNRLNSRNNTEKQFASAYNFLANNGFSQLRGLANRNGQNLFSYNRFGGSLGGPIVKNRAFFFAPFRRTSKTANRTRAISAPAATLSRRKASASRSRLVFRARLRFSPTQTSASVPLSPMCREVSMSCRLCRTRTATARWMRSSITTVVIRGVLLCAASRRLRGLAQRET